PSSVKTVGSGVQVLTASVQAGSMDALRSMTDELKVKLPEAVIVLGAAMDDKVNFVVAVPQALVKQGYHAGKLVKEVAAVCGGGGGGRPDMAQAGGKDASKLAAALAKAEELVAAQG
ncbi:DHHA1 domain-containing protein, partial [Paenibacillus durus]|uniref:DHHA1 domain-containing protein n=1 Tax=Paenibacillus durus TaxID=44251 RepID=UPI00200B274F